MASGHRKRKAAAVRANILTPAGYTNLNEADRGVLANQNAVVNSAFYGNGGTAPTFTAASTALLSDAVSNADSAWTLAGLTGETTNAGIFVSSSMSGTVGILSAGTKHYYFPAVGGTQTNLSGANGVSGPVIIYSYDGPQSSYTPYYLGGTAATASIKFGSQITGSGTHTHVLVYVGGQLATGDQVRLLTGSIVLTGKVSSGSQTSAMVLTTNGCTASAAELVSYNYRKAFAVPTSSLTTGLIVEFSSSAKTSTTPVAGVFVAISSGSY
ncbi:MAG: hypothetical protein EB127_15115 [Alphaproteobacteria bacterium]|nr:hypothetical protein [Alphaproteobacteria bacterium]